MLDFNLFDILTTAAGLIVAGSGIAAISVWKKQIRLDRNIKFIDELTDTLNEYVQSMGIIIDAYQYIFIGIRVYAKYSKDNNICDEKEKLYYGFTKYVKTRGQKERDQLNRYLFETKPIVSKLCSLSTKGQIYGFKNYTKCRFVLDRFIWIYNVSSSFSFNLGNTNAVWKNPEVKKLIMDLLDKDYEYLKNKLKNLHIEYLEYAREVYSDLFSNKYKNY